MGFLWDHYVLKEIIDQFQRYNLNYWHDKQHHKIDFILKKGDKKTIAIECK
ncbi:MAG: DUF4143 domain-containing protein [Candidatus Aminicenantaceae bacterium]